MKYAVSPAAIGSDVEVACQRWAPEAMSRARIVSPSATSTMPPAAVSERAREKIISMLTAQMPAINDKLEKLLAQQ